MFEKNSKRRNDLGTLIFCNVNDGGDRGIAHPSSWIKKLNGTLLYSRNDDDDYDDDHHDDDH